MYYKNAEESFHLKFPVSNYYINVIGLDFGRKIVHSWCTATTSLQILDTYNSAFDKLVEDTNNVLE